LLLGKVQVALIPAVQVTFEDVSVNLCGCGLRVNFGHKLFPRKQGPFSAHFEVIIQTDDDQSGVILGPLGQERIGIVLDQTALLMGAIVHFIMIYTFLQRASTANCSSRKNRGSDGAI